MSTSSWRRGNRRGQGARPAERYDRVRLRCPNCGALGDLIVGAGLYPYVEHGMDPEISLRAHADCWLRRDHPLVVAVLAGRSRASCAAGTGTAGAGTPWRRSRN